MLKVKCKGCPAEIVFAHDSESGARIPIDTRAPVYLVRLVAGRMAAFRRNGKNGTMDPTLEPGAFYGVTHYATCPAANQFGHSRRMREGLGYQPTDGPDNPAPPQGGSGLLPGPRGPRPPEDRARILEDVARAATALCDVPHGEVDVTAEFEAFEHQVDRLREFDGVRS